MTSVIPAQAGSQGVRICLLGAESTGKSTLALEIAAHLARHSLQAAAVPEVLREWCKRAGRAPRPEEQLAIAQEQEDRVELAARAARIVIADTSALMVAIYAGMLFDDGALYRFALERQERYDLTLVTGLDLPWVPDGLQRDAAHAREEVDALVRTHLQRAGIPFQVVYGSGGQRLRSALAAMQAAGMVPAAVLEREEDRQRRWTGACEKCSDPDCEHRLFTQLREGRG
ncbi:MAG TPA: ATP-binding protein [Ramlibacter sp.]|jgi:nicotinamide riboside kinase|nr:ATP-binding protein [Ramlibacter sp.]